MPPHEAHPLIERDSDKATPSEDLQKAQPPKDGFFKDWKPGHGAYTERHRETLAKEFESVAAGWDLDVWPADQYVFVPRVVEPSGECVPATGMATLEHRPEFDEFPGATAISVMNQQAWDGSIAKLLGSSGFRCVALLSSTSLCVGLFHGADYEAVPLVFRVAYVVGFLLDIAVMIYVCSVRPPGVVKQLQKVRDKRGFLEYAVAEASRFVIVVLGTPIVVKDILFKTGKPQPNISSCSSRPVIANFSKCSIEYEQVSFIVLKPQVVFIESVVLTPLRYFIRFRYMDHDTTDMLFSIILSTVGLLMNFYDLRKWANRTRAFREELRCHQASSRDPFSAAGRLTDLVEHPIRGRMLRCIDMLHSCYGHRRGGIWLQKEFGLPRAQAWSNA